VEQEWQTKIEAKEVTGMASEETGVSSSKVLPTVGNVQWLQVFIAGPKVCGGEVSLD
jgi:hypothetical protein